MKKLFLFIVLAFQLALPALAQEEDPARKEKIFREVQEFKMNYLAKEMDLSESQKVKFFELYEEMSRSKQQVYSEAMQMDRDLKKDRDATDEDYQQVTAAFNKANAQWSEEEKVYNEKFAEFLSQKQIYKMREAENNFRSKLKEMNHSRKKEGHHKKEHK